MDKVYSELAPLTIEEQVDIAMNAMSFFSPVKNHYYRDQLGLAIERTTARPLTIMDFYNWNKKFKTDLLKKQQRISDLFNLLSSRNLLSYVGGFSFKRSYYCMLELTTIEKKGVLFLGRYLGAQLIAEAIQYNLAHITGTTEDGDKHAGSGILVNSQIVLTCSHVLKDMKLDKNVMINNVSYKIKSYDIHSVVDFGAIVLEQPVTAFFHEDIALRKSTLLEKIVIAGFPKVPRKINDDHIVQSGEIAGRIDSYNEQSKKIQLELFTAISRPGNSGGPLLSTDGKLLGIVTQSLEREKEKADNDQSILPCFAAVPSDAIYKCFQDLEISHRHNIPWENYQ